MRHAEPELHLWLANDGIERRQREAELAGLLPAGPSATTRLRRRAGQALIDAGQRLLPAHNPQRSRAY